MRMEATEAYFKVQSQNLPGRTKEYRVKPQLELSVPGARFETDRHDPNTTNQIPLRDDILSFIQLKQATRFSNFSSLLLVV
jgi:hypothetical protein